MFEGQKCGGGWGNSLSSWCVSPWEEVRKGQDIVTQGLAVWVTGWWPSTETLMCLVRSDMGVDRNMVLAVT